MPRAFSSALVLGAEISNGKGEKIGQIEDLVVDIKSGHMIYAIVSFKNNLAKDDKYYPIPVKAIKKEDDENIIKLEIQKEMLEDAPSFEKKDWPKEYNKKFIELVYSYYGYEMPLL